MDEQAQSSEHAEDAITAATAAFPALQQVTAAIEQYRIPPAAEHARAIAAAAASTRTASMLDAYYKGVLFSPDGLCILSALEGNAASPGGIVTVRAAADRRKKRRRRAGAAATAASSMMDERKEAAPSSSSSSDSDSDSSDSSSSSDDDDDDDDAPVASDPSDRRGLSMFEMPALRWSQPPEGSRLVASYEYDTASNVAAASGTAAAAASSSAAASSTPAVAAAASSVDAAPHLLPVLRASPGDSLYDFCWNPLMHSGLRDSCWFLSTSRATPIHMWDAFASQTIRASYSGYDAMDELSSAISLCVAHPPTAAAAPLSPGSSPAEGQRLFAGYSKAIRVFDIARPGRDCTTISTIRSKAASGGKRARGGNQGPEQSGLISCLDCNPAHPSLLVAGSYNGSVGLYNLSANPDRALEHKMFLSSSGISQVKFSGDGLFLFVNPRREDAIDIYDMRQASTVLARVSRPNGSNLKMGIDVDRGCGGRYMVGGDSLGNLLLWDLFAAPADDHSKIIAPLLTQRVAGEALNGVSMHPGFSPTCPIVAVASGQRHFVVAAEEGEETQEGSREQHDGSKDVTSSSSDAAAATTVSSASSSLKRSFNGSAPSSSASASGSSLPPPSSLALLALFKFEMQSDEPAVVDGAHPMVASS